MIITFEKLYLQELYKKGKTEGENTFATICNITELSNHYK